MASTGPQKSDFADLDIQRLRNMVPIHTLSDEAFAVLLDTLQIESFSKGELLFREGDTRQLSYYLLEGRVSLLSGQRVVDTVTAGEESARFPIAHVLPRKNRVRAERATRVALLDTRRISELLARTHQVAYEVDELEQTEPNDWMSLLLQSPVLQQLPASNIQRVMLCVEQTEVAQGEVVIQQGDPGDYFYMLIQGRALVTRDEGDGSPPKELARLGPGSAFGEEALLSDSPRNSTITMETPGQLLRLAKRDFVELIQTPLYRHIDFDTAVQRVEKGAVWVDLRSPEDYEQDHFPGSVNLPIESLRYQLSSLAPDRHYVLCSNSGGRAAVAAFLLTEQGFDVSLLEGGLKRVREEQSRSPHTVEETAAGDVPPDASQLQTRAQEAEQRARELEDRLKAAEASLQEVEQQHQQQLTELKGAVDEASEKLQLSEQEKQAALDEVKKAYSKVETLTTDLERLASERNELAERLGQFEEQERKLRIRLEKVERELIGEREKAESASDNLEDISQRLNEVIRERELEREQHARERGELKEDVTCLQVELEQAVSDLEAMRARQHPVTAPADESLQQRLDEASSRVSELETQLASMQAESGNILEQMEQKEAELTKLRNRLADAQEQIDHLTEALSRQESVALEDTRQQEQLAAKVAKLEQELAEKTTALAELRADFEAVQEWESRALAAEKQLQEMADQMANNAITDTEFVSLTEQLQTSTEELQQLRQAYEALEQEYQQAQAQAQVVSERERELEKASQWRLELEDLRAQQSVFEREKQELTEELAKRQVEVDELRSVMETYVDQIQVAQEVNRLYESSEKELQKLREDLAAAREELMQMQEAARGNLSAAEAEAMRQELHELSLSLEERQNNLAQAERDRHKLEDTLEDTHAEVDRLHREIDRLTIAADEAVKREQEAIDGLKKSAGEIAQLQQQVQELEKLDLFDERLAPSGKALDVESVWSGSWLSRIISIGIGGAAMIIVLELLSFMAGRGELISSLLN